MAQNYLDSKLQVIITSYNRPEKVIELVCALNKVQLVKDCIIVDSGGNYFPIVDCIKLIRSSHKNQPYQRYLGYRASTSSWLLFLDDDMEPLEGWDNELAYLLSCQGRHYGMFALSFRDKHSQSYLQTMEKSLFSFDNRKKNPIINIIRGLTGYPIPPDGKYISNGVKGKFPERGGEVEYVSGGAFIGHRDVLYKNFNMQLFDLYDIRMGKGEDGILGYTSSKQSKIYYHPQPFFLHNDQGNSVYTQSDYQFNKLVAFSRAYLSMEYFRLNGSPIVIARCLFINYSYWRLLGMALNLILKPSTRKLLGFIGYIIGTSKGMALKFYKDVNKLRDYWEVEVSKDLKTSDLKTISEANREE